jgi:hypothetical protein
MSSLNLHAINNVIQSYDAFLIDLREDSLDNDDTTLLSEEFIHEFKKIINRPELDLYSPKKFYWLNLVDKLVDTLDVTEGIEEDDLDFEDAVSFLEGSEFLKHFLDEESDPIQSLHDILEIQEFQIISFFHLHINKTKEWQAHGPVSYRPIYEFAESETILYSGDNHIEYELPSDIYEGFLPLEGYLPKEKKLFVDNEDETIESLGQVAKYLKFSYEKNEILVLGDLSDTTQEKMKKAFLHIEKLHPELYEFLFIYTNVIIPIDEPGVVSYSMDTLPGYSCINIYERDFVDLLDDLIHENGHHYLNALIEGEDDLIIEDDDKIYYSPWRNALRPVRGLYHAVCTFYWAFELFSKLIIKNDNLFSADQLTKIKVRCIEESLMILACQKQIQDAHKAGKITLEGEKTASQMIEKVKSFETQLNTIKGELSQTNPEAYKQIEELELSLEKARKEYGLG